VHRDTYSGILEKSDAAIVTSGDYENFFEEQGTRYSHLLNPFTGYPDSDIRSVTIIAHETAFGDAIATAVFAMGSSEGFQFLLDEGIEGYIIFGDDAQSVSTPRFWD
jgi:thiamine biosynthesis lipoprotein